MSATRKWPLSIREFEVLQWSARGKSTREIGEILIITEHTVKTHRVRIFKKLRASNTAHAVAIAYNIGVFDGGTLDVK